MNECEACGIKGAVLLPRKMTFLGAELEIVQGTPVCACCMTTWKIMALRKLRSISIADLREQVREEMEQS